MALGICNGMAGQKVKFQNIKVYTYLYSTEVFVVTYLQVRKLDKKNM